MKCKMLVSIIHPTLGHPLGKGKIVDDLPLKYVKDYERCGFVEVIKPPRPAKSRKAIAKDKVETKLDNK